jgi:hypothetical protein
MAKQKQAGRQTSRPTDRYYTVFDYFAQDVRRILKRCEAPVEWGDEEVYFLTMLVLKPSCMTHNDEWPLHPSVQRQRADLFTRLSKESHHKLFRILAQITKMVLSRISRKGHISHEWLLVQNYTLWENDNVGRNKHPKRTALIDSFWHTKAPAVAVEWGQILYERFTRKDVDRARDAIRKLQPIKNPPPEWPSFPSEVKGGVRPFRFILGRDPRKSDESTKLESNSP